MPGLGATMDDVAARAGVGVGTMYRRWPNKDALIDALFQDRMAGVADIGRRALAHDDPWEGLVLYLARRVLVLLIARLRVIAAYPLALLR
jgi:AcrR family transcriptional regulator